jgi:magnesium transporter
MPTTNSSSFFPIWSSDPHQSQPIGLPKVDRMISIGISVAIAGNVLISLALNVQKLAHKRLEAQRVQATRIRSIRSLNGSASGDASRRGAAGRVSEDGQEMSSDPGRRTRIETLDNVFGHSLSESPSVTTIPAPETLPLLANHRSPPRTYSEAAGSSRTLTPDSPRLPRRTLLSRWASYLSPSSPSESALLPIHVVTEAAILDGRHIAKKNVLQEASPTDEDSRESDYLRSKLWFVRLTFEWENPITLLPSE